MKNNQVFLRSSRALEKVREVLSSMESPILQLGPGKGAITSLIHDLGLDYTAVQSDSRFRQDLKGLNVVFGNFLTFRPESRYRSFVSNLPFDIASVVLFRIYEQYPDVKSCLVVVPRHLRLKFKERTRTGITLRNMYEMELIMELTPQDFSRNVTVYSDLILLKRKECDPALSFVMRQNVRPKRKLRNQMKWLDGHEIGELRSSQLNEDHLKTLVELYKKNKNQK